MLSIWCLGNGLTIINNNKDSDPGTETKEPDTRTQKKKKKFGKLMKQKEIILQKKYNRKEMLTNKIGLNM